MRWEIVCTRSLASIDGQYNCSLCVYTRYTRRLLDTWRYLRSRDRQRTYRSLSSAACDASASLAVAVARRSSDLSRSSSNNWIRRFKAATSDSACNRQENPSRVKQPLKMQSHRWSFYMHSTIVRAYYTEKVLYTEKKIM